MLLSKTDKAVGDLPRINSLVCKTLQYEYYVYKIQSIIESLLRLRRETIETNSVPMMHYVTALIEEVFLINESAFHDRLNSVANFEAVNTTFISMPNTLVATPYDKLDNLVFPLQELPTGEAARKSLELLVLLLRMCLKGYNEKLERSKKQLKSQNIAYDSEDIKESLLNGRVFNPRADIDIMLTDPFILCNPSDNAATNAHHVKTSLIDADIVALFATSRHLKSILERVKVENNIFMRLKTIPKEHQLNYLTTIKDWQRSLHLILLLTIRTNEIYSVSRRVGRMIYLSNYQHLHDQKLSFQSRNLGIYLKVLKDIDLLLQNGKKNGPLIANLTRFFRLNSELSINPQTILDFSSFINQTIIVLQNSLTKLEEFSLYWMASELRFRKVYGLPFKNLLDIRENMENKNVANTPKAESMVRNNKKVEISTPSVPKERKIRPNLKSDKKLNGDSMKLVMSNSPRSSRSSSITSLTNHPMPPVANKSIVSTSPLGSRPASNRPSSMIFLSPNSSVQSLHTAGRDSAERTLQGRGRSNSQPTSLNMTRNATSGAAAALFRSSSVKSSNKQNDASKSPLGTAKTLANSIKSPSPLSRSSSCRRNSIDLSNLSISSPTNYKSDQTLYAVEEGLDIDTPKEPNGPKKLSANQRFQKHLIEARKSGELYTQQKEALTSVVFDPSKPLPLFHKRTTENTLINTSKELIFVEKMESNYIPDLQSPELGSKQEIDFQLSSDVTSSPSTSSVENGGTKRVRFTGVPDYTEAEDAPSKFSRRILKNFAAFKSPTRLRPSLRRKDQQLKAEESITLRRQIHNSIH